MPTVSPTTPDATASVPGAPTTAGATAASESPRPSTAAGERAAVEAAVRFYYAGYGRAIQSGDAGELARGSSPDCLCRAAVAPLQQALDEGRIVGADVSVVSVEVVSISQGKAVTNVKIDAKDGRIESETGQVIRRLRGEGLARKTVLLAQEAGTWRVTGVVGLS